MSLLLLLASLLAPFKTAGIASLPQASPTPTGIVSLNALRDRARPLLIFAARPDDPQLGIQLRRLQQNATAVSERDIVIIAIPYQSPSPTSAVLSDGDAQIARRRFNVAPDDFQVILIGKDGGEKLRSSKPLSAEKLSEVVDAMPMRQQELRSKNTGSGPR